MGELKEKGKKHILDEAMESRPDRVLSVNINEDEHELLVALFYNAACPEEKVILDADWEPMVKLAAKLGLGDIRQF